MTYLPNRGLLATRFLAGPADVYGDDPEDLQDLEEMEDHDFRQLALAVAASCGPRRRTDNE